MAFDSVNEYPNFHESHRPSMSHLTSSVQGRPLNGMAPPSHHRNGHHNQKENGVPVPGAGGFYRNGPDANNPLGTGQPSYDLARSPPGGPNKSTSPPLVKRIVECSHYHRHQTRSMQVLQTRHLSSWKCLSLLSFSRPHDASGTL
jgi:hypothetical protein